MSAPVSVRISRLLISPSRFFRSSLCLKFTFPPDLFSLVCYIFVLGGGRAPTQGPQRGTAPSRGYCPYSDSPGKERFTSVRGCHIPAVAVFCTVGLGVSSLQVCPGSRRRLKPRLQPELAAPLYQKFAASLLHSAFVIQGCSFDRLVFSF